MVTLHTIDGGTVNAINDALLYDFIIGQNGIATGATVTSEGALLLHIDSGWGVIKGRIFSIEAETISATPSTSGTVKGRLILQIDITNTTNPITFVTQAAATLPALQQEDINGNGTIYQLPIATYDVNEVAVSNLQIVAPVVKAINDRIGRVLIWENSNVSEFTAQTLRLNTSAYSLFLVIYLAYAHSDPYYVTQILVHGKSYSPLIKIRIPIYLAVRNIDKFTNTEITFRDCYTFKPGATEMTIMNTALIPYRIYGIK